MKFVAVFVLFAVLCFGCLLTLNKIPLVAKADTEISNSPELLWKDCLTKYSSPVRWNGGGKFTRSMTKAGENAPFSEEETSFTCQLQETSFLFEWTQNSASSSSTNQIQLKDGAYIVALPTISENKAYPSLDAALERAASLSYGLTLTIPQFLIGRPGIFSIHDLSIQETAQNFLISGKNKDGWECLVKINRKTNEIDELSWQYEIVLKARSEPLPENGLSDALIKERRERAQNPDESMLVKNTLLITKQTF